MYLMLYNTKVLYFDLDDFVVNVIRNDLLPFSLRNAFNTRDDIKSIMTNIQLLRDWLSERVLSMNRDNAKQLWSAFGFPQRSSTTVRVQICLLCRGLSVTDSYWIRNDDSSEAYEDVCIRLNKFRDMVDVSLYGVSPSFTTNYECPELTTHGLFRKAWIRQNGNLYLLKSDRSANNISTRMEVLASNILDCIHGGIEHVKYTGRVRSTSVGTLYVSKCENFVREDTSFVEAWEIMEYAKRVGLNYKTDILGYNAISGSMGVLDFILANTDRHVQNYGFFMNNKTGDLIGLAPLFDFNMALIADLLGRDVSNTLSQMFNDGSSILGVANEYKSYTSLTLDVDRLKYLRGRSKDYKIIFDNVVKRCRIMGVH